MLAMCTLRLIWGGFLLGLVALGCSSCESAIEAVPLVGDVYREGVRVPRQNREEAADNAKGAAIKAEADQRLKQEIIAHTPRATFKTTGEFADAATFLVNQFNASHEGNSDRAEIHDKALVIIHNGDSPYRIGHDFVYSTEALIVSFDQLDPSSVEVDEATVRCETSYLENKLITCSVREGPRSAVNYDAKCSFSFPDAAQATRFGHALKAAIESAKGEPTRY